MPLTTPPAPPDFNEPLLMASVDMIGHTGATSFQMRYSDDEEPVVWVAVAEHKAPNGAAVHSVGAALNPGRAAFNLCERLMDGGQCQHCRRPSGLSDDFERSMPLEEAICWFIFDPELNKFRRSCEGTDMRPCSAKPDGGEGCGLPEVYHQGDGSFAPHDYMPSKRIR